MAAAVADLEATVIVEATVEAEAVALVETGVAVKDLETVTVEVMEAAVAMVEAKGVPIASTSLAKA